MGQWHQPCPWVQYAVRSPSLYNLGTSEIVIVSAASYTAAAGVMLTSHQWCQAATRSSGHSLHWGLAQPAALHRVVPSMSFCCGLH